MTSLVTKYVFCNPISEMSLLFSKNLFLQIISSANFGNFVEKENNFSKSKNLDLITRIEFDLSIHSQFYTIVKMSNI